MGSVVRFPVERTRPAPLYAARLHVADVLLLPTVRIEREGKSEVKPLATEASGNQPASGKRRRTPRQ